MKSNDFNKLAFVYDRLARLVFGEAIIRAQEFFLDKIPDGSHVLILGGGSGSILENLLAIRPAVKVSYIEASEKMLSLARARLPDDNRVQFICGTENDIPNGKFNVVISNFYLDLFKADSLELVLNKIHQHLIPNASWIVTDFVDSKWWHRVMLKIMYVFFKLTANIEAKKLSDWNAAIAQVGGQKRDSKFFYKDFIEAAVFQF